MGNVICVPHTYAAWVSVLDMLKDKVDDEAVLAAMQQGTLEWQSGVAERFAKKLIDTINFRLNQATDNFQKALGRTMGQEREIIRALLGVRKELAFLAKAIDLPVLPDKDRQHYCRLVRAQADSIQKSLEDSSKSDRTGKMTSLIRNNRVNAF